MSRHALAGSLVSDGIAVCSVQFKWIHGCQLVSWRLFKTASTMILHTEDKHANFHPLITSQRVFSCYLQS